MKYKCVKRWKPIKKIINIFNQLGFKFGDGGTTLGNFLCLKIIQFAFENGHNFEDIFGRLEIIYS